MDPARDPHNDARPPLSLADRLRESWFPPAAVVGAFAVFLGAAYRSRPAPPRPVSPARSTPSEPAAPPPATIDLPRRYTLSAVLAGASSPHPFRRTLSGVAATAAGRLFALGDGEVRTYDASGQLVARWPVRSGAACLASGPDGSVFVGSPGRVDVYASDGRRAGGFASGAPDKPAAITAIKPFDDEILVADASARLIRRHDAKGRPIGEIGTQNKTRGFILPNRSLDFDIDASGVVRAADSGRHRVTAWTLDGAAIGAFGAFNQRDPRGFVGCCNPVNIALTPDGKVVTAEKMVARVKVYEPDGTLLSLIGPDQFDQQCTHLHLDVDAGGRILVADPVRREVKVFAWS